MRFILLSVLTSVVCLLTSCLGPISTPQIHTYTLQTPYYLPQRTHGKQTTLLVSTPTASAGYMTKKMRYNKKPYQLAAFTRNEWAGPPADMLQPLLVQSLRNTGYFHAVVSPPFSGRRQLVLKTHLLDLRQDFTQKKSRLCMAIQAVIIDNKTKLVINSRTFAISIPTPSETPYGGVLAANRATSILLRRISQFCVRNLITIKRSHKRKNRHVVLPHPQSMSWRPLHHNA